MNIHPDLQLPSPEELKNIPPEEIAQHYNSLTGTLGHKLGFEFMYISSERVVAKMPVEGNMQPVGRLHGGASLALAEEVASIGSWMSIDYTKQVSVGVDVSGTHVRGVTDGWVTAEAKLIHPGRSILVWNIEIRDERGKTVCLARCTCNVISL